MTKPSPLAEALAALRSEITQAEAHLADLYQTDGPIDAERLAAAADVHAARLRARVAERAIPGAAQAHRSEIATQALAELFDAPAVETPAEGPEDGPADPLADLFA